MNRWLSICALWLCQLLALAQAGAGVAGGDFNPNTPPNPEMPRPKFTLTTQTTPSNAGGVSIGQQGIYEAGSQIQLRAYNNNGYVFEKWLEDGVQVSTNVWFYYEMPERNATLTAVFRYDPMVPGNPVMPRPTHTLTLNANPWQAGYFNFSTTSVFEEDQEIDVWAYNYNAYRFVEWQVDGVTVSKMNPYRFTMPSSNYSLVAVYEWSPQTPPNPGRNYFNSETGEVIIDDFADGLYSALEQVTNGDFSQVTSLTVAGPVENAEWWFTRELKECTLIDLTRTSGMTAVPSWAFEGNGRMESILLPASVGQIGEFAFYGCSSLQTLTCMAVVPPAIGPSAFDGVNEGLVVFVPAASLAAYQEADGWSRFTIQPLESEVSDLEVNLPEGTDPSMYKDMYIELVNVKSGQKQRYLMTNRITYTFGSLIHNTQYNVYLKNGKDAVLGEIKGVGIVDKDVSVTFESLLRPRDLSIKVLTPAGEDVTEQVTVTWMDENGDYLNRGRLLTGLLEGTTVRYRVSLPQSLAMQYLLPTETVYEVGAEGDCSYTLTAIPQMTIGGAVRDVKTEQPIAGAVVSVSQLLNGQYSKTFTTKTDSQGHWSLKVFDAKSEIAASMANYVSKSLTIDTLTVTVPTFNLKDINGTTLFLNLTYTDTSGKTSAYEDASNVVFAVKNETTGEQFDEMSVQNGKIVLMETVPAGTSLRVTASSMNQKFTSVSATATVDNVDRANFTLPIKQLGGISASFVKTDNTTVVGILYDQNGRLVKKYDYYGTVLSIAELQDGDYTLVTMGGSRFFNSIYVFSQFAESGLRAGVDYVKNSVKVKSGAVSSISNQGIPFLDETKLYYTGKSTSFAVNKSQVTAGQYLTLSSHVDFKSAYVGRVSDVKLIVELPDASSFVDGSVMVGNATAGYTYAGHTLTIPLENYSDRMRFCFIPTAGGDYSPSASVQFTYDGKTITQPIGSASYTVKDLSVNVPGIVAGNKVPVSGSAMGKSNVKIYANGILMGQTVALANGSWATTIELEASDSVATYQVYALVSSKDVEMKSETQTVVYDPNSVEVTSVTLYYTNPEENWWRGKNYELVFDFLTPSVIPHKYVYYIYNRSFTFAIDFSNNADKNISNVVLDVKTGDGVWHGLKATYDTKKSKWLAYGEFGNMYDGIVPVNVRVRFTRNGLVADTLNVSGELVAVYPGPDCNVAIDPSGYVYEAVPTNRIQGVTASIYYKETVEDVYGDKHEKIVLWNAEEYAQENPLFTDENGMYRWDVPTGLWQVKFEKEGYETAYSEWLPVPPPQLDVNIAMTQMRQPSVVKASAFEKGVEMEFDKYMIADMLTSENITVTRNGERISGELELLNKDVAADDSLKCYASKVRFNMPENDVLLSTDEVRLTVSRMVQSYSGVPMAQDYTQVFNVEPKVRTISIDSLVNVEYGGERTLTVAALPADASKGKKMVVRSLSSTIAAISTDTLQLDTNGQAELTVSGELPGTTMLTFGVVGTDVEGRTTVSVKEEARLVTLSPKASRVTGSQVYRGTQIRLSSETENAAIYYTLDGTEPQETSLRYDDSEPIVITSDDVQIKAMAIGHDLPKSDVSVFDYSLKKSTLGYQLPEGWSWISHNLESEVPVTEFQTNADRIVSQTQESINDPVAGFIGNLKVMKPTEAYKLKLAANTEKRLADYEFNAATQLVPVEAGWNWIGYPVNQVMTLDEALAFYDAHEGDFIVGQDGYAEFVDGQWKGTLEGMKPGQGYLHKAAAKGDIPFNTTLVSVAASRVGKRNPLMNSPWAPAKYAYPDVMPLTAQLAVEGLQTDAAEYVVGAFAGTECRGVGQWKNGRLMMSVYGEQGDEISFVAYHKESDRSFEINEKLTFVADNVGCWNAPRLLTIGNETTAIETTASELTVTPMVFADHVSVSAPQPMSMLTLTNMGGQQVVSLSSLGHAATLTTGQLPAGTYILTVKAGAETYYKKIMKAGK